MPWAKKGHRRCPFRWRNRRELIFDLHGYRYRFSGEGETAPVKNIVVSAGTLWRPPETPCFFPWRTPSLCHRHANPRNSVLRFGEPLGSGRAPSPRRAIVPIFGYHHNTKTPPGWVVFCLAEKERFELSRRVLWQPTPLAGAPLRPLEYFSIHRRVGLLV